HGDVGVGPRARLHVGVLGAEQGLAALAGEVLHLVDHVVAAVVALARVPLGVLVGEDRTGGLEHGARREVLRRDQLHRRVLPLALLVDQGEQLGIARRLVHSAPSISAICSTRRTWRPPSKSVDSHRVTISSARPNATIRPPMDSTFASLCWRERRAVYRSLQRAARIPRTLLAAICSPCPLPPSTIPRSARPSATVRATPAQMGG